MGDIIQFPTAEYTIMKRRADYIGHFFASIIVTAKNLGINIDNLDAVFYETREAIDKHLEIDYEDYSEGSG